MNQKDFWELFSKTGRVDYYLKYAENKNISSGVKDGEILSRSAGNKAKEYR